MWSGKNVSGADGVYSFTSWDESGSANRLDYTGELGDNNTISFKYAPSITANGSAGEPSISFNVQTADKRIRIVIIQSFKAAYIYLDDSKLLGENYVAADGLFNQTDGWIDIKFVFANGQAELVIDYLGDGIDVFSGTVKDIDFTLADVTEIYFTSWGANAGIKDIVFSKTE